MDTADASFPEKVTLLAQNVIAQTTPVYAPSCIGVGKGSLKWSEEDLIALEIGVVGGFARGCIRRNRVFRAAFGGGNSPKADFATCG